MATALLVPVTVLAHEAGHLAAGLLCGVPEPRLTLSGFSHGFAPWLDPAQVVAIALAGPVVILMLAMAGLVAARRPWAGAAAVLAVAAGARALELLPFALPAVAAGITGRPAPATTFDEDLAFRLIGLPGAVGLLASTILLALAVALVLRRQPRTRARGLGLGALAGLAGWRLLAGLGVLV